MDNLTHSLFGLTLAGTSLRRAGRGATVALLLASNVPDIDIVTTVGGAANYLHWHRGPTHGPLGVVALGFVSAGIAWLVTRRTRRRPDPPAPLLTLWLIAMLGVVCHVLMDLPTSYGVRPLSPFSWTWYAEDWMPIVDVYLLAILGGGLLLARRSGNAHRRSRLAAIAIGLMIANYGVRAVAHRRILTEASAIFGTLPERCDDGVAPGWIEWWPRVAALSPRDQSARRCLVEIAALPNFISPFRWRLIAQLSNAYELRDTNLLDGSRASSASAQISAVRYPNQWTPAVVQAAASPSARVFLGFSRFPAARSNLDASGTTTVRWADMRFVMNPLGEQRPQGASLFGATVRVGADGAILDSHLGP